MFLISIFIYTIITEKSNGKADIINMEPVIPLSKSLDNNNDICVNEIPLKTISLSSDG